MKSKTLCPACRRPFEFDPDMTPVQRGWHKRRPRYTQVLAYYPTCPHCYQKVEVTSQAPIGGNRRPAMI